MVSEPVIANALEADGYSRTLLITGSTGLIAGATFGAIIGAVRARDRWQAYRFPRE